MPPMSEELDLPDPASLAPTWTLVCSGELGNDHEWKPGFEDLERLRGASVSLEGVVSPGTVRWDELATGLGSFGLISRLPWPPLYSPLEFELLAPGLFMSFTADPLEDAPGRAFTQFALYIDTASANRVCLEARALRSRMGADPVIGRHAR